MALSFSTVSDQNIHSVLRPFGSELAFTVTSSTSLAGKEIFIVPAFYVRETDVQSLLISDYPRYGYRHTYPGSNGTADMTKQSHDYDFCHENVRLSFTRSSTTQFTVTPYGLTTMDIGKAPSTYQLDSVDRCMKSHRLAGSRLENITPSVFREDRVMRFYVVVTDGDYQIEQQGKIDIGFAARWYEKGLYDATAEWSKFDYNLYQNGSSVDGVSLHTDTVIRFQFDKGATNNWDGGWWVYIFRETGQTNTANYWDDIKLNGKFFSTSGVGSGALTGVDSSAIVSSGSITNIAGNLNYVDITFDSSYFEKGYIYRAVFVPAKLNDFSNSFITDTLKITDYVPPTKGDVTDEIEHYDQVSGIFLNCVSGVAVGERLRFKAIMDKTSYDANILTNVSAGTFDTNLRTYKLYVTEQSVQSGLPLNYGDAEAVGDYGIVDNATENGGITTLRMQEAWAGKTMFLTHEWTFDIKLDNGLKSQDVVYYQQIFSVDAKVSDSDIEFLGFFDENGDALTKICATNNQVITARFENLNIGQSYDLIAILDNEKNTWTNSSFIKLNSQPIVSLPENFDGSELVDVEIDTKLLDIDKQYTLQLIGISETNAVATCGIETIEITQTYAGVQQGAVLITIDYGSFSGSLKKLWFEVTGWGNKLLGSQKFEFTADSEPGQQTIIFYPKKEITKEYSVTLDYKITVFTTDGCYLSGTTQLTVVDTTQVTDTVTVNLTT